MFNGFGIFKYKPKGLVSHVFIELVQRYVRYLGLLDKGNRNKVSGLRRTRLMVTACLTPI